MEKFVQRIIEAIFHPREDVAAVHAEVKALRADLAAFINPPAPAAIEQAPAPAVSLQPVQTIAEIQSH